MADGHFCDDKNRNLLRLLNNDGEVSDLILSGDASCPIFWPRKLQTEIALSTAEAECIALSTSLREVDSSRYPSKRDSRALSAPQHTPYIPLQNRRTISPAYLWQLHH